MPNNTGFYSGLAVTFLTVEYSMTSNCTLHCQIALIAKQLRMNLWTLFCGVNMKLNGRAPGNQTEWSERRHLQKKHKLRG